MDVDSVKVKDNAQEIARIINSAGRPVAADAAQTALPMPHVPEAKRSSKFRPMRK